MASTITRFATETDGISPKAILAGGIPALTTLVAVLIMWAVTSELDRLELVTALTGLSSSLLAGFGAWLGQPGRVVVPADRNTV